MKSKAYSVVKEFEHAVAEYAGAEYGVAVESCCAAIFLSLMFLKDKVLNFACIPKYTYPGVAMAIKNAGYDLSFYEYDWDGTYELGNTKIIDSALRFKRNMYLDVPAVFKPYPDKTDRFALYCLSFHSKKLLPIGRGGMILTDDTDAYNWLKMARFDGRKEDIPLSKDNAEFCGWNMYMTPEQAARGLTLFDHIKNKDLPDLNMKEQGYPDLSKWRCFNG